MYNMMQAYMFIACTCLRDEEVICIVLGHSKMDVTSLNILETIICSATVQECVVLEGREQVTHPL